MITADTLERAYEAVVRDNPDLIVLNARMPDGSGVSFYEKIRGETAVRHLRGRETKTDTSSRGICFTYITVYWLAYHILSSFLTYFFMPPAHSATSYRKDIYFSLSDFYTDNRGIRSKEAFFDIYLDEVPPDLFEIWNPEDNTKGEFHIRYFTVQTTNGNEKIRYQLWGGPVEGNNISIETLESIQIAYLGALRDAENELKPAKSGKLANLFSSIVNTDEAKEQVWRQSSTQIQILKRNDL